MTRSNAGFTLIEAVVAAGLLTVVALGTMGLMGAAMANTAIARQQLVMATLAESKLNDLSRDIEAGAVTISPADALDRTVIGAADTVAESGRTYLRRWRVAPVPGYDPDAYAIVVRVMPVAGAGGDVRLTTIRAPGAT
jgi:type II secretory pathway pseudopilin PulG